MAFTYVRNMISGMGPVAPPKDNLEFISATETKEVGMPCKFDTDGKLAKLGTTDKNGAVIALEKATHSPAQKTRVEWIVPGNVYKVPLRRSTGAVLVAGNDKHAETQVGAQLKISDDGLAADGQTQPNVAYPLTVIKLDYDNTSDATRAKAMAWVTFAYSIQTSPA